MIDPDVYLDMTLAKYAGSFDITKNYSIDGKTYPAYGYFFSQDEKYVGFRQANLWTVQNYEHIIFLKTEECSRETLDEAMRLITEHMEPVLVRHGEKYPQKNHMSSFLTIVVITGRTPSPSIQKAIQKFYFDKGYLFSFRGYSQGQLVVVDLSTERVWTNSLGKRIRNLYESTFDDIRRGAKGFHELYESDSKDKQLQE